MWILRNAGIIAAVLVLIGGGIALAVQGSGTDSGVDACKFLASGSDSATAAQIEKARGQFAGSDDAALRTSGVDLMDIVAKLQASGITDAGTMENLGRIMTDYAALTVACAKHGVTLPAIFPDESGAPPPQTLTPGKPAPSEEPNTSAGAAPAPSPSIDCSDPTLPQDVWVQHCASNPPQTPAGATIGEPFAQTANPSNSSAESDTPLSMGRELVWQIPKSANVGSIDFTSPPWSVSVH